MNVKQIWQETKLKKIAIPSFNFSSADVALTIARTIKTFNHICLISTSERELKFQSIEVVVSIASALKKQGFPIFLNLDHGKTDEVIKRAIDLRFDCIHFDGSELSLEENIKKTKEIVFLCKDKNISVEGEVGRIGGSSTVSDESTGESVLTDPTQATRFVKETGVDILACSFGSYHGLSLKDKKLKTDILDTISKETNIPFVLHGGSGIEDSEIRKAIMAGVVKINFNTELRLAWSTGIKDHFASNPKDILPVNVLSKADERVKFVLEKKIKLCLNS